MKKELLEKGNQISCDISHLEDDVLKLESWIKSPNHSSSIKSGSAFVSISLDEKYILEILLNSKKRKLNEKLIELEKL